MLKLITANCLLLISFFVTAQTIPVDSLLARYNLHSPQEKMYIHFDNTAYLPGQTIWYKAYFQKSNENIDFSRNLYFEWFDEAGKLITRSVSPVITGTATGSFTVPEKYNGNSIRLLSYTRWMLNFDSSFLFRQTIPVLQTTASIPANQLVPETFLHFFPEGGDMVTGIVSRIAFKATNASGLPVTVNGIILNSRKEKVADFRTVHDGMGSFSLTAVEGEKYYAEWRDTKEQIRTTELPPAKKSGVVLQVNTSILPHAFSVTRKSNAEARLKKLKIIATMNQELIFSAVANLTDKNSITASLPTGNLASGILQLTILDADQQPVAERILFVNNHEFLVNTNLLTDTLDLGKRGRNVYSIEVNDTVPASLSLSVLDGEGFSEPADNIVSRFLLSSDIKGYVHNPAYYFSSDEDSVEQQLDLVMLTNGWRRFAWQDLLSGKIPSLKYQRDTGYLSIEGNISRLSENKIKKAETLNLIVMAKDSSRQFIFTSLNPDGSFREDNLVLFDTSKVFYQLNKTMLPLRSKVTLGNGFLPFDSLRRIKPLQEYLADTTGMARIKTIEAEQKRLDELTRQTTLREVVVKAKVKTRSQELNEKYTSGLFSGSGFSRDFNIVDDVTAQGSANALFYLQSKVPGLIINNAIGPNPYLEWRRLPVRLFLDEFPSTATEVQSIPISSIAYIKVFNPPFAGNVGGGPSGAIAVYTKKGDDASKGQFTRMDYSLLPGYTPVKEFYQPDYAKPAEGFSRTDLRRTLLWKPDIVYGGDGKKITLSFYNNDISHTLQLVLEGITQEGRYIRLSKTIK